MSEAVTIDGIQAGYQSTEILHGLSFSVDQGEILGIIGPNGAGKTTLLRVLAGFHSTTAGSVNLCGRTLADISPRDRARIVAVVPQELSVPMPFTVEELVRIGRTSSMSHWGTSDAEDMHEVERAMTYTDVIRFRDRRIQELSGGEKQRVVIAMALAQTPKIILMDEVTSHLDLNHRIEVMQIVQRLSSEDNVTVIMTSHDINMAAEFCQRLVLIDQGTIKAIGTPADVLKEKLLKETYGCEVHVHHDPATGLLRVLPAERLSTSQTVKNRRVHIIGGGGGAQDLLRRVSLLGCSVTCGVLNREDSDALVADALGIKAALETAFSPIAEEALSTARSMVESADTVIIAPTYFGPGNVANISLAEEAFTSGKQVLVATDNLAQRDCTVDGQATVRIEALIKNGAESFLQSADAVDRLLSRP